jgi:hypothetical protein
LNSRKVSSQVIDLQPDHGDPDDGHRAGHDRAKAAWSRSVGRGCSRSQAAASAIPHRCATVLALNFGFGQIAVSDNASAEPQ